VPYVFQKIPNTRRTASAPDQPRQRAAAWRAPNHPQSCFLTMSALADTARRAGDDELEFFLKNVSLTDRAELYAEELKLAADMNVTRQGPSPEREDGRPGENGAWHVDPHLGGQGARIGSAMSDQARTDQSKRSLGRKI